MRCYTIVNDKVLPWIGLGSSGDRLTLGLYENVKTLFLSKHNPPDRKTVEGHNGLVMTNTNVAKVGDDLILIGENETPDYRVLIITIADFTVVNGNFKTIVNTGDEKLIIVDQFSILKFTLNGSEMLLATEDERDPVVIRAEDLNAYTSTLEMKDFEIL